MSFEDDMLEDGFHDEQDYLEHLCYEADRRLERIKESDYKEDDYCKRPSFFNINERKRRELMIKFPDGSYCSATKIHKRYRDWPLVAGHIVVGPRFDYIDMDKAVIIPAQYDQVEDFRSGITRCHKGRRWVLINELCEELPLNENESVEESLEWEGKRFYLIKRQERGFYYPGLQGLLDENGNVLLPTIFKFINVNSNCLEIEYDTNTFNAPLKKKFSLEKLLSIVKKPAGFLDWEKDSWPEEIIPFADGVRAIRRKNKWGFEQESGVMIVECQYFGVQRFRNYYDHNVFAGEKKTPKTRMLAIVENDDYYSGCIDLSGKVVFHIRENVTLYRTKPKAPLFLESENKLRADYHSSNNNDIIPNDDVAVQVDGSLLFDRGVIIPAKYDWGLVDEDFIDVIKDGLWGMIDKNGNEIIPCKYDERTFNYSYDDYLNNKLLILSKKGKYGKVNNKGEEVVPFIYDNYASLPQG